MTEATDRLYAKLYDDLGSSLIERLYDKTIDEIMANPDGQCWMDSLHQGLTPAGFLREGQAMAIIQGVAGIHQKLVNAQHPCLEATLPFYKTLQGERFTAQIPPIVIGPCFSIRKKSAVVLSLADYVTSGRLRLKEANLLEQLVAARHNILVCGGPGSGKTTFVNALIKAAVKQDAYQRFILLEDLPELQCRAVNQVAFLANAKMDMTALLKTSLRMRPDRLLIGEVRGAEALTLLKAWNTGCPWGMATVHANGAREAMQRLVDLTLEAGLQQPPIQLLLQTVDVIVGMRREGHQKGTVHEIVRLRDYHDGQFIFETVA
jgi:P-type conjugative transfer ATPase TrbB